METMIYIALFGILMSGALVGVYNLVEGGESNTMSARVEEEGTFLNRKINWALTGASSVTVSPSGDEITITRPDLGAQSPIKITSSGEKMTLSRGTGAAIDLNDERLKIENLAFVYTPSINGRPPSVHASFKVKKKVFTFRNYLRQ